MRELKKLYWESSHYLGGRLAVMALGFISFPLFTHILSVSEYGILSLVLTTVMAITAFAKLGMQNAVQRFYGDYANSPDPCALQRYYSTLFLGAGLVALASSALYVSGVTVLPASLMQPNVKFVFTVAGALIVVRAIRSMQMNLLQVERKTILLNTTEIINKAGTIALILMLFAIWKKGIEPYFLGTIIFEGLVVLALVPSLIQRRLLAAGSFDTGFFRYMIAFSIPLMSAELAWLVLDTGDRFLIGRFLGSQSVGYYSAAYNIAYNVQDLVTMPLSLALLPICLKIWSTEGEVETSAFLSRSFDHFALAATFIIAAFTVVSRDLIVLLASSKYETAHSLLPWLVSGVVLSAGQMFFKPGLLIRKKVFIIARVTVYAAVINIVLNLLMLPRIGVKGAAIATLLSYAAWIGMMAKESLDALSFEIHFQSLSKYLVAAVATVLLCSRIHFETLLLMLVAKGAAAFATYVGILWVIDAPFRQLIRSGLSLLMAPRMQPTKIAEVGATAKQ
jgi:O-antigen/teichoic acid export membrane protein